MYRQAQWLSDPQTTVTHLSRLTGTPAATGLWDACGGVIGVVCRTVQEQAMPIALIVGQGTMLRVRWFFKS